VIVVRTYRTLVAGNWSESPKELAGVVLRRRSTSVAQFFPSSEPSIRYW